MLGDHVAVDVRVVLGRVVADLAAVDAGVAPLIVGHILQSPNWRWFH